jgi:hypothetical protein
MAHDNESPRNGLDVGRGRRSLLSFIGTAIGLIVSSTAADAGKKRPGSKDRNKNKDKNKDKNKNKGKNRNRNKKDNKRSDDRSNSGDCQASASEQQILNFIADAAKKYNQSKSVMERVARCESSLNPCAVNRSGPYYGLFQYLKSTWNSTPYGDRSIWDPEAQALATGWMWEQGRKDEWACQ